MADFPALPIWTDAYLADLLGTFTLEEHGCMFLLMQAAWRRRDCNLPDDDKYFCRFLGIHGNAWRKLKTRVLHRLWKTEERDGETFWYHKRLRKERDFVEKRHRNAVEKGRKGGRVSRKNKDIGVTPAKAPTPTPTPIEEEETLSPVSNTESPTDRIIPTQPLPPAENSANGQVIELKEAKPEKQYAFQGDTFRITVNDFQKWRRSYWAIPDLMAMLEHIDLWYANAEEGKMPKRIFFAVAGWLSNEHQKRKDRGATMPRWLLKEKGKC